MHVIALKRKERRPKVSARLFLAFREIPFSRSPGLPGPANGTCSFHNVSHPFSDTMARIAFLLLPSSSAIVFPFDPFAGFAPDSAPSALVSSDFPVPSFPRSDRVQVRPHPLSRVLAHVTNRTEPLSRALSV